VGPHESAIITWRGPKRALSTMALATYLGISRQSTRRAVKAGLVAPTSRTPGGQARFTRGGRSTESKRD
jgi:hypothetical protein